MSPSAVTVFFGIAVPAKSKADFTLFGVAAVVVEVDEVESVSWTMPTTVVDAAGATVAAASSSMNAVPFQTFGMFAISASYQRGDLVFG
jgi:hypothetical protein